MEAYAEKICIALQEPSADAPGDSRTRLLDALGREHVRVTLSALQVLYPAIRDGRGRVTVTLSPADEGWELVRVEPGDTSQRLFALALDIGTTTLEMELLHLPDGAVLSRAGCFNGQCAVGDNILDRIFYAKDEPEHLRHLQELVLESIRGLITQCCEQAAVRPEEIAALGAAGNTTMMHLLLGCEPWQIFQSPYTPVFLDPGVHSARELGLPLDCNIFCMPAVANYLGGDITSGLLLTDLDARDDPAVFLDVGTNGELALGCREYLLAGAGAAGPALEGAVSRSGMRAEPGAVCRVRIDAENRLHYETIGGAAPKGICGSGIVDLLAEDENISRLYDLWYEKKYEILRTYTSEMPPKIPLSQNKEFKSIKNDIIREAMKLHEDSGQTETNPPKKQSQTQAPQKISPTVSATAVTRLFKNLCGIFQNKLDDRRQSSQPTIDKRQKKEIEEKKNAEMSML